MIFKTLCLAVCVFVSVCLIAQLWVTRRRDSTLRKIFWSLVLLVPIVGWIFYGGFYRPPESDASANGSRKVALDSGESLKFKLGHYPPEAGFLRDKFQFDALIDQTAPARGREKFTNRRTSLFSVIASVIVHVHPDEFVSQGRGHVAGVGH